jgi:hypothetical protein
VIPAKRFLKAFTASRSVNNGGFLTACLRHQGLLHPAPEAAHQHVMGDDWGAWKAQMLQIPSEEVFISAPVEKPSAEMGMNTPVKKDKKSASKGKKAAAPPASTEDHSHDHPA